MQLISPQILGPLWKFNIEFHRQAKNGKIIGYKNLGALRARVAPALLRRRKEEVLTQLPPITFQTRYVALSPEQTRQEEEHRQNAARIMARTEHRGLTLEEMEILRRELLKARQACNAAELCDKETPFPGSPKLDEFESIIGEICEQGSQKILVFSEWVEMLKLAAKRLDRIGVGYRMLHGGVPPEKRPALLDAFRADPDARVLLSSDAGGAGLNLQIASYIIHLDLPWNPARLDQRTARAHRLGQTRGVTVLYLCSEIGIERGIEGTLDAKRQIRSASLDADSSVEEIQAPSFSVFLAQMRKVVAIAEQQAPQPPTSDAAPPLQDDDAPGDEDPSPSGDASDETDENYREAGDDEARAQAQPDPEIEAAFEPEEPSIQPLSPASTPLSEPLDQEKDPAAPQTEEASSDPFAAAPREDGPDTGEETSTSTATSTDASTDASTSTGTSTSADASASAGTGAGTRKPAASHRPQRERLRMARVLLEAAFPAQALRAAYEALALAIVHRAEPPVDPRPLLRNHGALVALIYRDLLPSGLLPPQAPAALAKLHDLTSLEEHGIDVDTTLALDATSEAEAWIERLDPAVAEGG